MTIIMNQVNDMNSINKELLRKILKNKARFLYLMMITLLGSSTYIALNILPISMNKTIINIYNKYNVFLVFGFYSVDVNDEKYIKIKSILKNYKENERHIINYHGIVIDDKDSTIYCDITRDFDIKSETVIENVNRILKEEFPEYKIHVNIDTEFAGEQRVISQYND